MTHNRFNNGKNLWGSLVGAVILAVIMYFLNNLPILTGENFGELKAVQELCQYFHIDNTGTSDVIFIDVGYDKKLVEYPDTRTGKIVGNIPITDRTKLCELLKILECSGYKYIVLDILLDSNYDTEEDSLLYEQIGRMNNIVLSGDKETPMARQLQGKAAMADYTASSIVSGSYCREEYLRPSGFSWGVKCVGDYESVPLAVYEALYPEHLFKRYGYGRFSLYFSSGRLCHNCLFPTFSTVKEEPYLRADLISWYNECREAGKTEKESIETILGDKLENKIFVIGDMTNDIHETYAGDKSGGLILYRAFKSLEDGKHIVGMWSFLFWFLLYFIIGFFMTSETSFTTIIPQVRRPGLRVLMYFISLLPFSLLLFVGQALCYISDAYMPSILFPIVWFSILKMYVDFKSFAK